MVWPPDFLGSRAREIAGAILANWPEEIDDDVLSQEPVLAAVVQVQRAPDESTLRQALEAFVDDELGVAGASEPASTPAEILLRGLYSIGRQFLRSADTQNVLGLCNDVRSAVEEKGHLSSHPNELMAALMVVEDAVNAIEGYAALPPFQHVDEAYLAKYGLLQALQVGFDAVEAVARCLGTKVRADAVAGGKTVKVARNIVAGHPIGGTMAGESWHHFHDRSTAHDKAVIRVMSFSRADPERWTGQTLATDELIADGVSVIATVLTRALGEYMEHPSES